MKRAIIELKNNYQGGCLRRALRAWKIVYFNPHGPPIIVFQRVPGGEGAPNDCKWIERIGNINHIQSLCLKRSAIIV